MEFICWKKTDVVTVTPQTGMQRKQSLANSRVEEGKPVLKVSLKIGSQFYHTRLAAETDRQRHKESKSERETESKRDTQRGGTLKKNVCQKKKHFRPHITVPLFSFKNKTKIHCYTGTCMVQTYIRLCTVVMETKYIIIFTTISKQKYAYFASCLFHRQGATWRHNVYRC